MPNLGNIIANHNSKIIGKGDATEPTKTCSCPKKDKPNCPLGGQCLVEDEFYASCRHKAPLLLSSVK